MYEIPHSDGVFTVYLLFDDVFSFSLILCSGIYQTVIAVPRKVVCVGGVAVFPVWLLQAKEGHVHVDAVVPVLYLRVEVGNEESLFFCICFQHGLVSHQFVCTTL